MGYDIPADHSSGGRIDRRNSEPEGYDEYARKPKDQRRYTDPADASIARVFPSVAELNKADLSCSLGFGGGVTVAQMVADMRARQIESGMDAAQSLLAKKPRVRVHTFTGGHSKAEYTRVMFAHAEPRLSLVRWMTTAKAAWDDFAHRLRLGQP